MRPRKTLEEHREYLHRIVGLKLHFLHRWLSEHTGESFRFVLRHRVDIYRKTDANPGAAVPRDIDWSAPLWADLEDGLEALWRRLPDNREQFEAQGLDLLRPSLDARCRRDFADPTLLAPYDCGCLRLERSQVDPQVLGFHIANPLSPGSIFDDPLYLPSCFLVLINQAEARWGAQYLETYTWLNDLPRWQSLFPVVWTESLTDPDPNVAWHYGYWGQFLSARGTFRSDLGARLRATGQFPYYPRRGQAPVDALRQHFTQTLRRGGMAL